MKANKSVYLNACLLAAVLPAVLTSGCATLGSMLFGTTCKTGGEYTNRRLGLVLSIPSGWYMDDSDHVSVYVTKAGYDLNVVHVSKNDPSCPLPFTGKSSFSGLLSVDAAGIVLDEERHYDGMSEFKSVSNSPATVAGCPGCRLEYTCRFNGIAYRTVTYGFVSNENLYRIRYVAPERFYFGESSVPFEKVVTSVRLR